MEIDFLGLGGGWTNTNSNPNPNPGLIPPSFKDDVGGAASSSSSISMDSTPTTTTTTPADKASARARPFKMMQRRSISDKPSWMLSSFLPDHPPNPPFQNVIDVPAQPYCMAASGFPLRQLHVRPVGSNHEMRKFPHVSTHPGQVLMSGPLVKPQPPVLNSMLLQTAGADHTATFPVSHPLIGSPVPRDTGGTISPGAMTQLTIFFAGSVSVYDDVSPDKAQAIMSLARNSSSASPSKPVTMTQVPSQPLRPSLDGVCVVKSPSMLPSPSSLVNTQPVNTKHSVTVAPTLVRGVAIPQARKVSLARFLEQRKERMINVSPYGSRKRSPKRGGIPSDSEPCHN